MLRRTLSFIPALGEYRTVSLGVGGGSLQPTSQPSEFGATEIEAKVTRWTPQLFSEMMTVKVPYGDEYSHLKCTVIKFQPFPQDNASLLF